MKPKRKRLTGTQLRAQRRNLELYKAMRRRGKGAGQGIRPLTRAIRRALNDMRTL